MMWSFSSSPVKQYRSDVESWILTKLLAPLDNSKFSCTARYLNRGTEHSYSWPIYFQPLTAFSFPLLVVYTSNNSISLSHKTSTSHQHQPASSTFLSQKISSGHQHQPAEHSVRWIRWHDGKESAWNISLPKRSVRRFAGTDVLHRNHEKRKFWNFSSAIARQSATNHCQVSRTRWGTFQISITA